MTRREKDLCFNCNEKFHKGHKCVSKVFLLIAEEDDDSQEAHGLMDPLLDSQEALASSQAQISLHTLSGHLAPKTL